VLFDKIIEVVKRHKSSKFYVLEIKREKRGFEITIVSYKKVPKKKQPARTITFIVNNYRQLVTFRSAWKNIDNL
jgi:hypothetical protein